MKAAIKHNLLLLKRMPPILIILIVFSIGVSMKDGSNSFIKIIPFITFAIMATIESFDDKKHNILFSLPITRMEFAKAKFLTMLIIYGATTLLALIIYIIYVLIGYMEGTNILKLVIELFATFPVSIFLGLIGVKTRNVVPVFIIFILLNSISFSSTNFLQLGVDKVLDTLIIILLLWFNRFAYVLVKENFINIYSDMEL